MTDSKKLALFDIKNEILANINMVEFIEEEYGVYMQPSSKGWYKTNCLMPKHRDSNPSFGVNPDIGLFKCLSCGAKGDLIELVKAVEGLSFFEALRRLAEYAGIALEEGEDAQLNRVVRQITRDINSYLNGSPESLYPAQMTEPAFMCAIASRLKRYEKETMDIEWVDAKYSELDSLIEDANYNACEKMWNKLSEDIKNRKRVLSQQV
jgi:hypothetical protein